MLRINNAQYIEQMAVLDKDGNPQKVAADAVKIKSIIYVEDPRPMLRITLSRVDPDSLSPIGKEWKAFFEGDELSDIITPGASDPASMKKGDLVIKKIEKGIVDYSGLPVEEDPTLPDQFDRGNH